MPQTTVFRRIRDQFMGQLSGLKNSIRPSPNATWYLLVESVNTKVLIVRRSQILMMPEISVAVSKGGKIGGQDHPVNHASGNLTYVDKGR